MTDFNRHLKKNKVLVFFTIFAFLYMSCFTSCSKAKNQENAEKAQKSGGSEQAEKSKAPRVQTAGSQQISESSSSAPSDSNVEPCAGCPPAVDASGENAGQRKPLTQKALNQTADKLERYYNALERTISEIPRDTFDPQAIADQVGKDHISLFQWVRDNTSLVPYQGVLRGPIGVLMDRLGNSLDRTLLLGELLTLAGYNVRLARGTLSEKQAREILTRARQDYKKRISNHKDISREKINEIADLGAQEYQLDRDELYNQMIGTIEYQEEYRAKLKKRADNQTDSIYKVVEKLKGNSTPADEEKNMRMIQDHWWVQLAQDAEWLDMDPTLGGMNPGDSLTEMKEAVPQKSLPDEVFNRATIRVVVEQWADGEVKENIALEHNVKPSEIMGSQIALRHLPLNWPKNFHFFSADFSIGKLKDILLAETEWLPFLQVGPDRIVQSSFTDRGEINKNPAKKSRQGAVGGLSTGLFTAFGGGEKDKAPERSYLTSEWIEYEIYSCGESPKKIRREIFDLIGPSARAKSQIEDVSISDALRWERSLAILSEIGIFIQTCDLSNEFMSYIMAKNMLDNRAMIVELLRDRSEAKAEKLLNKAIVTPGPEYSLALVRRDWNPLRRDTYISRPNILSFVKRLGHTAEGGLFGYNGFDIVSNEVSVSPIAEADPFRSRVYQGVLDTNAEAYLTWALGGQAENTAEIYAESKKQNRAWLVIDNADDRSQDKLEISTNTRERINHDLQQGFTILCPQKPVPIEDQDYFGWWRINLANGDTLGIGQNGAGDSLTEYIVVGLVALPACFITAAGVESAGGKASAFIMCAMAGGTIFAGAVKLIPTLVGGIMLGVFGTIVAIFREMKLEDKVDERWGKPSDSPKRTRPPWQEPGPRPQNPKRSKPGKWGED